ncbi:extracellular solute-binding protein [Jiangella alkaliphila]|uniref:Iron(III) transport system substrate-binding protein n=1 Tax=Jiangella alkaliphila TaxID=419479 RepID=A0A1H2LCD6_9ACTN|nr:extracellular solute-binding protein [Jiangella alkaliphila]SDU78589.1 iron(III) transport system substrate-binding protein [Jiangella alkaliphila]
MRSLRPGLLAATLGGLLLLSACGDDSEPAAQPGDDATEEPAGDDAAGSVVVYSGRDEELVGPLIEQFEEASGITVEVRYAGTTELAAQLLEEGERTPADVFLSQDAGALGALASAGRLATLPDEVTSAVAPEYSSRDGSWVALTGRARVIAYDSQTYTADQVPGDVLALTDPQWRGQVAIAPTNASFQSFVTALRVTEGEDVARAWLEGLIANEAQIHPGNGQILEAVNAGTAGLGLINHYYWAGYESDPAALRVQLKFGDPGSVSALVNTSGVGIVSEAAESEAAHEFVDFLLSEQAQTYFAEETAEYPLIDGIDGPAGVPALADLGAPDLDLSELESLEDTVALLTEVGLL